MNEQERRKRNFYTKRKAKQKNSDLGQREVMKPERGGCLIMYLGWRIMTTCAVMTFLFIPGASDYSIFNNYGMMLMSLSFFMLNVICLVALWNWKRWGYYGLFVLMILDVILFVPFGNMQQGDWGFVGGIVSGFLLYYYVTRDYVEYLE